MFKLSIAIFTLFMYIIGFVFLFIDSISIITSILWVYNTIWGVIWFISISEMIEIIVSKLSLINIDELEIKDKKDITLNRGKGFNYILNNVLISQKIKYLPVYNIVEYDITFYDGVTINYNKTIKHNLKMNKTLLSFFNITDKVSTINTTLNSSNNIEVEIFDKIKYYYDNSVVINRKRKLNKIL